MRHLAHILAAIWGALTGALFATWVGDYLWQWAMKPKYDPRYPWWER